MGLAMVLDWIRILCPKDGLLHAEHHQDWDKRPLPLRSETIEESKLEV